MPSKNLWDNPFFVLITFFLCVLGPMFLYAVYLDLKHGRTGWFRGLLAAGIVYGLADELGFKLYSPSSMSIVCSILFSAAWIVDVIGRSDKSNCTVAED